MWFVLGMLACVNTVKTGTPQGATTDELAGNKTVKPVEKPPATMSFATVELTDDMMTSLTPTATSSVTVNGTEHPIGFQEIYRSGQDGFGDLFDKKGNKLKRECNEQDFNALFTAQGHPWLVSHFECTPGEIYMTRLKQDAAGKLSPEFNKRADFSALGGVWNPCAGQVSPWGTHLGGEEYEPNAARKPVSKEKDGWDYITYKNMLEYTGDTDPNPYHYGWTTEVAITSADGDHTSHKHYAAGRFSHEIAYVLPDKRTTYLSDDGTYDGFYMFVADKEADLSAGNLYAARWRQQGLEGMVEWIPLGHASNAAIDGLIKDGITFDDIFEKKDVIENEETKALSCPTDFKLVIGQWRKECLKLKLPSERVADPAMAASRLETRRYAGYLGATLEFEKGEGITYDPVRDIVYLATSAIKNGMVDNEGAHGDHIKLPLNKCGGVLGGHASAGTKDASGKPINSDHVVTKMFVEIQGKPLDKPDAQGNKCDVSSISNPDNITFLPHYDILMLGEDTSKHKLNVLWAHNTRSKTLERVLVSPQHGEVTGIHWTPNLGGFGYLSVAIQHPWEVEALNSPGTPKGITAEDQRSFTGFIGPFPRLDYMADDTKPGTTKTDETK